MTEENECVMPDEVCEREEIKSNCLQILSDGVFSGGGGGAVWINYVIQIFQLKLEEAGGSF